MSNLAIKAIGTNVTEGKSTARSAFSTPDEKKGTDKTAYLSAPNSIFAPQAPTGGTSTSAFNA